MQETCVTVTLMKFFYRLSVLTGDSKYVDAFETSLYNAYLGSINTEKVIESQIFQEYPDSDKEPLPFDSYSPLTAGTRGNGVGGLKLMSDNHYYGCCACIGSLGLGLVSKVALVPVEKGMVLNLFFDGLIQTASPAGNKLILKTETGYPADGKVRITVDIETSERFELKVRIPAWSKQTHLAVNGQNVAVKEGYVSLDREWAKGDVILLEVDMRTECLRPIPYGHQVLMNEEIWGANYMIPTYDEEDPIAKNHLARRRGPIRLAQDNRLGYSVDEPADIMVGEDGYVDVTFPEKMVAPYDNILEVAVPLADGSKMHVTDYASAGKLWNQTSKMAAWMLV